MSGNEILACFVVSGRSTASGGFVKKFACKTLLRAGFGLSSSPRGSLTEWVEGRGGGGGGGGGGKAKKRRRGEQRKESRHAVTFVRCYGAQAFSR